MSVKSLAPHFIWLVVVTGSFAAGTFLTRQSNEPGPGGDPSARRVVSSSAANQPGAGNAPGHSGNASSPDDIASFLDQYRIGSTGRLNEKGMAAATLDALRESDPVKGSLMFAMLLEELTPENAGAARDAISETTSGRDSMRFLTLFNYKWGAIDGAAAVVRAQEDGGWEANMSTSISLSGWASADPDAALAWLDENAKDGDDRTKGWWMRGLINGVSNSDPDKATKLVTKLAAEDPDSASRYVGTIARTKLKDGVASADTWMNSLDNPKLREGALATIGEHLSRSDPKEAAQWIQQYADEPGSERAVGDVADEWAEKDPKAAVDWVKSLDPGDSQNRGMNEVLSEWSRNDPTAASQYLSSMPDGGSKDHAITGLVRGTLREEPESALEWANTISDPDMREKTMIDAGASWLRRDKEAAAAWMGSAGLPESTQNAMIESSVESGRGRGDRRGGFDRGRR